MPIPFLERLFGSEPAAPKSPRKAAPPAKIAEADFAFLTMDEIIRGGAAALGTKLHIITLRAVKEAIGAEWVRYVRKISLIAESIVRRHLGPKATCGRQDDDTFILSFTRLSDAEGRKIAATVAFDLMRMLVGDRFGAAGIAVAEVELAEVLDDNRQLNLAALQKAIDAARRIEAAPPVEAAPAVPPVAGGADAPQPVAAAPVPAGEAGVRSRAREPQWVPLRWPPEDPARREAIGLAPLDPADALGDGLVTVYRPTLAVRQNTVECCLCLPARRTAEGMVVGRVLPAKASPAALANLDFAVLHEALSRLAENVEARRRLTMIVPLRFNTVQPAFLPALVALLQGFSDGQRSRFLILELTGVPKGLDEAEVREAVRTVRALCRDVFVRLDPGAVDPALLKVTGPAAFGFDLAALRGRPDTARLAAITAFARLAAPRPLYLWSADQREEVDAAIEEGYIAINGDAVKRPVAAPGDVPGQ